MNTAASNAPFLDAALDYQERSWASIPILRGDNKKPSVKWGAYQKTLPDPADLARWFHARSQVNIGLVTGQVAGFFVLDEDGEDGTRTIEAYGGVPETVVSGRGDHHNHYYFRHPGSQDNPIKIWNQVKFLPGLDLRGDGGYVVAPPSLHHSGAVYRWLCHPDEYPLADAPDWVLDFATKQNQTNTSETNFPIGEAKLIGEMNGHVGSERARHFCWAALTSEAQRVAMAPDGAKHRQLLNSAIALGGLIATGGLTETEIEDNLFGAIQGRARDAKNAQDTIQDGIRYGKAKPRLIRWNDGPKPNNGTRNSDTRPEAGKTEAAKPSGPKTEPPTFSRAPLDIVPILRPVPTFPKGLIPTPLQNWLVDIADRMSCPLEYPTCAAIIALSSLVGRKCGIRPKRHDDWIVVANLWGGIIGPPGVHKTPATDAAIAPLKRLVAEAINRHAEQSEYFAKQEMIAQAEAEAAKAQMRKKAGGAHSREEMEALADQAMNAKEGKTPPLKRYIVNDATVEALGERLKENPMGLMVYRDELTGFLRNLDKQGHESDRAFYLEAWNGTVENFVYDRIGRGVVIIPAVCLALFGTIQPGPIGEYLRKAGTGISADGFVPRFQLLLYPDVATWEHVDRPPDALAKNRAFDVFRALDNLDALAWGARQDEDLSGAPDGIPYFTFDAAAQQFFDEWWIDLENNKLRSGEGALLESHLAKYRSLMPTMALLCHLVDLCSIGRDVEGGPVTLAAAQRGAAWCQLLEEHARRVYQMAFEADIEPAQRLADRLLESLPNPFTVRQVVQKGWQGLTTTDDVECAVAILEGYGWVQGVESEPTSKGGRPTFEVWLNPALLAEAAESEL